MLDREGDAPSTDVLTVTYAAPTDQMTRAVARAGIYIAAGSGLLLLITVALAVLGLRRGLRPLAELATSAALVNTSNWKLNPSEAAMSTTELAPLTQAMTAMLDGLHRAFTQQREFLANAELNTFHKKYGIKIVSENPSGSSAQEIQAIKTSRGRSRRRTSSTSAARSRPPAPARACSRRTRSRPGRTSRRNQKVANGPTTRTTADSSRSAAT